jgi:hypothetical protein
MELMVYVKLLELSGNFSGVNYYNLMVARYDKIVILIKN